MTIPARMTAIAIREPGGPEVLVPQERDVPAPKRGEVLVKVAAAGVNRPDVMQREGQYPPPPGRAGHPGPRDRRRGGGARRGRARAGSSATRSRRSCPAAAMPNTRPCTRPTRCRSSRRSRMVEAAAIPETFFTVWHNVFERGALKAGETMLIHGGSSGIGTTAIMLAKATARA